MCAMRGTASLLLAQPSVRQQLSGLAAEAASLAAAALPGGSEAAAGGGGGGGGQPALGCSQMLMVLLSLLFLLAVALPLHMRAQVRNFRMVGIGL